MVNLAARENFRSSLIIGAHTSSLLFNQEVYPIF
jgi:hypothetical protein